MSKIMIQLIVLYLSMPSLMAILIE